MLMKTLCSMALSLALFGVVLGGCGGSESDGDTLVRIGAVSDNLTVKTLMNDHGELVTPWAIQGTYGANCKVHAGESWQLTLNDPTDRSLEVVLNDNFGNCPLTMTGMVMEAPSAFFNVSVEPPVVLGLDLAAAPSAVNNGPDFAFYTNAELNDLNTTRYTNDFTIRMLYSDDATVCGNESPPAIYAMVTATAEGSAVPPPDYTMDLTNVQLVVDADNIVQGSSFGDIKLFSHLTTGEEWKLFEQYVDCCGPYTFASIDNHYLNGVNIGYGWVTSTGDLSFDWSSFGLLNDTLPTIRILVVKHTGEGGVYSYQLFHVLFNEPN